MLDIMNCPKYFNLFVGFSVFVVLFYTVPNSMFALLCVAFVFIFMMMMNNTHVVTIKPTCIGSQDDSSYESNDEEDEEEEGVEDETTKNTEEKLTKTSQKKKL